MDDHTLQQVIDLAVKTAVLKAKKEAILECRPVGSYFITETEDDPNVLFGGGWEKLMGRYVLQCSDDTHVAGTTVEAGLPNIEGSISLEMPGGGSPISSAGYKALYNDYSAKGVNGFISEGSVTRSKDISIRFDASRSNSIYGRSDTVQPPALCLHPCIRYE